MVLTWSFVSTGLPAEEPGVAGEAEAFLSSLSTLAFFLACSAGLSEGADSEDFFFFSGMVNIEFQSELPTFKE